IVPKGSCEFFSEFAMVLPVARFCRQLGVPDDRYEEFLKLGEELIYGSARVAVRDGAEAAKAHRLDYSDRIEAVGRDAVTERRLEPGDDVVSTLLEERFEDRPLTDDEILNIVTFLFYAGTDSTSTAIAFAVLHLATHPDDRDTFVSHPEIRASAVEE